MLLLEGLSYPAAPPRSQWSSQVVLMLSQLACPQPIRFKLDQLLALLENSTQRLKEVTVEVASFCKREPELSDYLSLLQTVPGIGPVVSSYFLARVGDPSLIENSRQLASFLGLGILLILARKKQSLLLPENSVSALCRETDCSGIIRCFRGRPGAEQNSELPIVRAWRERDP